MISEKSGQVPDFFVPSHQYFISRQTCGFESVGTAEPASGASVRCVSPSEPGVAKSLLFQGRRRS